MGFDIHVAPGTEIASIPSATKVTLTLPLIGTATGSNLQISGTFTGDNAGTLIVDAGGDCYQKTNYRGDPHEFGGVGDGVTDDTQHLQDWLGAYGNVFNGAPSAAPSNFGPWDATIPATYVTNSPLSCANGINIRAPSNQENGGSNSLVRILAGTIFNQGSVIAPAILTASGFCHISGLAIDAGTTGGFYHQSPSGSTSACSTPPCEVTNLDSVSGVQVGDSISASSIADNSYVTSISPPNVYVSGVTTMAPSVSVTITGLYAVDVTGYRVLIDQNAILENGYYNVNCHGISGFQIKDTLVTNSYSDDIHLGKSCNNVRLLGDIIQGAGQLVPSGTPATAIPPSQSGVFFQGYDLTLSGGVVENSVGIGLDLSTANFVSVTGMFFDSNGEPNPNDPLNAPGGSAIEIDNSRIVSICGNHFNQNDNPGALDYRAHIRFGGTTASDSVSLCGNVYHPDTQNIGPQPVPDYVYDISSGTPAPTHLSLYDDPGPQMLGIFSPPAASALLPQAQAIPGVAASYISGLILRNDLTSPNSVIDVTPGQAADSTNSFLLQLPSPGCSLDVSGTTIGAGGLDQTTPLSDITLFFFVIGGGNGQNTPAPTACMASASTTPSFANAAAYSYYRMIGALYTDTSSNLVQFVQNDDVFSLRQSAQFTATLSPTSAAGNVPIRSVPNLISVDAFGRCSATNPAFLMGGITPSQTPSTIFAVPPGYTVQLSTPATAYPFSLYTVPANAPPVPVPPGGELSARSSSGSAALTCYGDGWIWHRGR